MSQPNIVVMARSTLGSHREEWDALAGGTSLPVPFLRSWWLESLAGTGSADSPADSPAAAPLMILVLSADRLVGGVPLAVDRVIGVRRYRFLGQGTLCPDHLDALAAPGQEELVTAALTGWLREQGTFLLDLDGLRADSLLASAAADAGAAGTPAPIEAAPYEPVPAEATDFLSTRSSSFRRTARRTQRRLAADGFRVRPVADGELRAALDAFWDLHRRRADRGDLVATAPLLDRILTAGFARGEVRLDLLEDERTVVAASVGFQLDGRLRLYQVARSTDEAYAGAGTALLTAVVDDAVAQGVREIDFLRGEEGYKSHFASHRRPMLRLIAARGLRARLLLAAARLMRRLRSYRGVGATSPSPRPH